MDLSVVVVSWNVRGLLESEGRLFEFIHEVNALVDRGALTKADAHRVLDALNGKRPLVKRSFRPPNYETPLAVYRISGSCPRLPTMVTVKDCPSGSNCATVYPFSSL